MNQIKYLRLVDRNALCLFPLIQKDLLALGIILFSKKNSISFKSTEKSAHLFCFSNIMLRIEQLLYPFGLKLIYRPQFNQHMRWITWKLKFICTIWELWARVHKSQKVAGFCSTFNFHIEKSLVSPCFYFFFMFPYRLVRSPVHTYEREKNGNLWTWFVSFIYYALCGPSAGCRFYAAQHLTFIAMAKTFKLVTKIWFIYLRESVDLIINYRSYSQRIEK